MSNSLRDQLLKAGLITQEQIEQANQPKPKEAAPKAQSVKKAARPPQTTRPTAAKPPVKPKSIDEDLAKFYKERETIERNERLEAERQQRELAARRKAVRGQIQALINENLQNVADAEIRYNFVVGENIKYVYVTEAQQTQLANGELALTFLEGKRCIIPLETAQAITELDPDKIIIINQPETESTENSSTEQLV
jgi:hypothetical protein